MRLDQNLNTELLKMVPTRTSPEFLQGWHRQEENPATWHSAPRISSWHLTPASSHWTGSQWASSNLLFEFLTTLMGELNPEEGFLVNYWEHGLCQFCGYASSQAMSHVTCVPPTQQAPIQLANLEQRLATNSSSTLACNACQMLLAGTTLQPSQGQLQIVSLARNMGRRRTSSGLGFWLWLLDPPFN